MTYKPITDTAEFLKRLRDGLTWLREVGLVEPMELIISTDEQGRAHGRWQFCYYMARSDHPRPRCARNGYTHPARLGRAGCDRETAGDVNCEMPSASELQNIFAPLPVRVETDFYEGRRTSFQWRIVQARLTRQLLDAAVA